MIAELCACNLWTDSVNARDAFFVPSKVPTLSLTLEVTASVAKGDVSDILRSPALEQEVLDILDA